MENSLGPLSFNKWCKLGKITAQKINLDHNRSLRGEGGGVHLLFDGGFMKEASLSSLSNTLVDLSSLSSFNFNFHLYNVLQTISI